MRGEGGKHRQTSSSLAATQTPRVRQRAGRSLSKAESRPHAGPDPRKIAFRLKVQFLSNGVKPWLAASRQTGLHGAYYFISTRQTLTRMQPNRRGPGFGSLLSGLQRRGRLNILCVPEPLSVHVPAFTALRCPVFLSMFSGSLGIFY